MRCRHAQSALRSLLVALLLLYSPERSAGLDAGPLIIAHRGASAYAPEHSKLAYTLALSLGADVIEPDLQLTKDGLFVVSHNPTLDETTNAAERFPERIRTRTIDGLQRTGVFASDLTAAEVASLRLKQRVVSRDHTLDGLLPVMFLHDAIDVALNASAALKRPVGIYPELKHPSLYAALGFDPCGALAAALRARGLPSPSVRVYVQCFEAEALRACRETMRRSLPAQPLFVQLVEKAQAGPPWGYSLDPAGLDAIAGYAEGIGAAKELLLAPAASGRRLASGGTGLVAAAKARGLLVHAWTFAPERAPEPADPAAEFLPYLDEGVDGFFAEAPDQAVRAAERWRAQRRRRRGGGPAGGPPQDGAMGSPLAVAAGGCVALAALVGGAFFVRRRLRLRQEAGGPAGGYERLLELGQGPAPNRPQARGPDIA